MKEYDDHLIKLVAELYLTPGMTWDGTSTLLRRIGCDMSVRTLKRRVAPLIKPPSGHARCPCCKRVYASLGVRRVCAACEPTFVLPQNR